MITWSHLFLKMVGISSKKLRSKTEVSGTSTCTCSRHYAHTTAQGAGQDQAAAASLNHKSFDQNMNTVVEITQLSKDLSAVHHYLTVTDITDMCLILSGTKRLVLGNFEDFLDLKISILWKITRDSGPVNEEGLFMNVIPLVHGIYFTNSDISSQFILQCMQYSSLSNSLSCLCFFSRNECYSSPSSPQSKPSV